MIKQAVKQDIMTDDLLGQVNQLTPQERLQLVKQILAGLAAQWPTEPGPQRPRRSRLSSRFDSRRGQRMAAALEQLAAIHALAEITDPAAWERENRQDRALPGRGM
jgi:hypothetical protein